MGKCLRTMPMLTEPFLVNMLCGTKSVATVRIEATMILGLLRHNEEHLVEKAKNIMKKDKFFFQEVFSLKVDEWTPMHACTLKGARKLVKLALKAGVDPNIEMGSPEGLPGRCTPLHLAAYRGDVSIMQLLIHRGALLNKRDDANCTPLYYALRQGNTLAAKKLLKSGADPSELSHEERLYYEEFISKKGSAFLCIPVRAGSQSNKNSGKLQKSKPSSGS